MSRALPLTRGDCVNGPRACPHVRCRYSLALERGNGAESCALDIADRGGATLDEVGQILGVHRQRVQQIEAIALRKLLAPGYLDEFEGHEGSLGLSALAAECSGPAAGDTREAAENAREERDQEFSFEAVLRSWRSPDAPKSGTQMALDFNEETGDENVG